MNLAHNIKQIREEKGLLQKQVAAEVGLKPAHYNKIENGAVEPSIEVLQKLATFYQITIDMIVNLNQALPQQVVIEDKSATEQLRLIALLNENEKAIIYSIIDLMLTKQRFQTFFQEQLAPTG
jgi:transcriptional regulator with XRE-family HTH domain